MRDVYVVAVGMIPFGRYPEKGIKDLTAMVMKNLLTHSPVSQEQIEAAWMSNAGWGMSAGQHCIRGQVALAPLGIGGIPTMNVENACAGGSSAFHGRQVYNTSSAEAAGAPERRRQSRALRVQRRVPGIGVG